jgi:formate dehydrogenase
MVLSASLRSASSLLSRQFLRPSVLSSAAIASKKPAFGAISGARGLTATFNPQVKVLAVLYDVSFAPCLCLFQLDPH